MTLKANDWAALRQVFTKPTPTPATSEPTPSAPENGAVVYLGEPLPKWLARDLMQERAAIREYDGGEPREVAEAETRKGLKKQNPAG